MNSQTAICGDRLGWGVGNSIKLSSKDLKVFQDYSSEYTENITIDLINTIYPLEQSKKLS